MGADQPAAHRSSQARPRSVRLGRFRRRRPAQGGKRRRRGRAVPHAPAHLPIHAIVTETAASLFGLLSYRGAKAPLAAMCWGAEDLSAALGASSKYDADGGLSFTYRMARSLTLAGAVAAGVQPVDGVFADFRDEAGLHRRSRRRRARRLHRQARHPSRSGGADQRRLHALRGRHRPRGKNHRRVRSRSGRWRVVGRWSDGRPPPPPPGATGPRPAPARKGTHACRLQPRDGAPTPPTSRSR